MTMHDLIQAQAVTVQKQKNSILRDLNFTIKAGSITGLIGPSGSGKTTLMRSIVGAQMLTSGALSIFGSPAGSASLRPRIGYVTQSPAIYSDLTVGQNLHYFAKLVGATKLRAQTVMELIHLADKKNELVSRLSGGQKARVSLGIALLNEPEVLVLDEPTVGLDPILRQELWQLFAELSDNGVTLIISSHAMDEAERCDDILLMRDGELLWKDSLKGLLAHTGTKTVEEAFVALVAHGEAS